MIPKIIHFIYFTPPNAPAKVFPLSYYIAMKSAIDVNRPDEVIFHFDREPVGEWWEATKPFITLHQIVAPNTFMGQPLLHPAHKADVVRLLALQETGGIYLDLDTISVKPLTPLLTHSFVIGEELEAPYEPKNKRQELKYKIRSKVGLTKSYIPKTMFCNGVLLSEKNSPFVEHWLNTYKTFRSAGRDKYWNEHSSVLSKQLAQQYPHLVTVLSPYCFHFPLFNPSGMKAMFEEKQTYPEAYLHHLWESFSWQPYLSKLTIEDIKQRDTTYNCYARQFL